jgi:3-mercaptopropionate dioxygenase
MSTSPSPGLERLVCRLRRTLCGQAPTARNIGAVMEAVSQAIADPSLLRPEQRLPDSRCYRQHILHVEADGSFSVVALVWAPGQSTPVHDHRSWCVVGVIEGEESEMRFRSGSDSAPPIPVCTGINRQGSVQGLLAPDEIHHVANRGTELAVSLHVYGTDLARHPSSIRHRYELAI